jgi:hypothetical protein
MKPLSVRLGFILIGLLILGNAEVWGAECAWVLWASQYFGDERTGSWTIESAFPNYELCMKELNRNLEGMKKGFERAPRRGEINSFNYGFSFDIKDESGKEKHVQFLWKCLPDTIDPRK